MTKCTMIDYTVGYEHILPVIANSTYGKKVDSEQLSELEYKQLVANTYREAVIQVMRDTDLFTVEVPVDVFEGVQRYDIIPPKDFLVSKVIEVASNKYEVTSYTHTKKHLMLSCCPDKDVARAFYVKVALIPKITANLCEFDEDFVNEYHPLIIELIFAKMLAMPERKWKSLEQAKLHHDRYDKMVADEKRKLLITSVSGVTDDDAGLGRFIPSLINMFFTQTDEQMSESEFRTLVTSVYREAVANVMRDTLLYQVELPVSVYNGVDTYPIEPPKGYIVEDVVDIIPNEYEPTDYTFNNEIITLGCCPTKDTERAFYVKVSLVPTIEADINSYDKGFVSRYHTLIAEFMYHRLFMTPSRKWTSLEQSKIHHDRYVKAIVEERRRVLMSDLIGSNAYATGGYARYLPIVASTIYTQIDEQISVLEFKQLVATVFTNAVTTVMRETKLFRQQIPITVYAGVDNYKITPPKGYLVEDVVQLVDGKVEAPIDANYTRDELYLSCCPDYDMENAFYADVALVPTRSNNTFVFDSEFVDRYYDIILEDMWVQLYGMSKRAWGSPELMDYHMRDYHRLMNKLMSETTINEAMLSVTNCDADFSMFAPKLTAILFDTEKSDLKQSEFSQILSLVYRDALIRVMRDTRLYRVEIPIDVYQGVKRYDIIPPKGFIVEDIVELLDGEATLPRYTYHNNSITLSCCTNKDVQRAFYANVALSVTHSGTTPMFDGAFIDKYYDLILSAMCADLYGMSGRYWFNQGQMAIHQRQYEAMLDDVKRDAINGGAPIKVKSKRLSDYG